MSGFQKIVVKYRALSELNWTFAAYDNVRQNKRKVSGSIPAGSGKCLLFRIHYIFKHESYRPFGRDLINKGRVLA